ncbi:hypothetical protein ACVBGC_17820 [Burkholderia stagnalis]
MTTRHALFLAACALLCPALSQAERPAELESGLIAAMKLAPDKAGRAGDSGNAIRAYIAAGYLAGKPNRRVDYTDYWLLKRPAPFMGNELVMIEEEYMTRYVGCCVSPGVGVTVRLTSAGAAPLETFAAANGCSLTKDERFADVLHDIGVETTPTRGRYASLSCRERDLQNR